MSTFAVIKLRSVKFLTAMLFLVFNKGLYSQQSMRKYQVDLSAAGMFYNSFSNQDWDFSTETPKYHPLITPSTVQPRYFPGGVINLELGRKVHQDILLCTIFGISYSQSAYHKSQEAHGWSTSLEIFNTYISLSAASGVKGHVYGPFWFGTSTWLSYSVWNRRQQTGTETIRTTTPGFGATVATTAINRVDSDEALLALSQQFRLEIVWHREHEHRLYVFRHFGIGTRLPWTGVGLIFRFS